MENDPKICQLVYEDRQDVYEPEKMAGPPLFPLGEEA